MEFWWGLFDLRSQTIVFDRDPPNTKGRVSCIQVDPNDATVRAKVFAWRVGIVIVGGERCTTN